MSDWVEVWLDSASGQYVLLVRSGQDGRIEVVDPQQSGRIVERFATYEAACHWLNEDEYDLVEGRWSR